MGFFFRAGGGCPKDVLGRPVPTLYLSAGGRWRGIGLRTVSRPAHRLRLASAITALNVLIASGFSIAGLLKPEYVLPAGSAQTQASLIFAMYAAARTLPLALMALAAIWQRSALS